MSNTKMVDLYAGIGNSTENQKRAKEVLSKTRAKVKAMAKDRNLEHDAFVRQIENVKSEAKQELESILGNEHAKELLRRLLFRKGGAGDPGVASIHQTAR